MVEFNSGLHHTRLQVLVEGDGISLHAAGRDDALVRQLRHFAAVPCVDAVSLAETGVSCHHHEVFTSSGSEYRKARV